MNLGSILRGPRPLPQPQPARWPGWIAAGLNFLSFSGRRQREVFGFAPRFTIDTAFDDYVRWMEWHQKLFRCGNQ